MISLFVLLYSHSPPFIQFLRYILYFLSLLNNLLMTLAHEIINPTLMENCIQSLLPCILNSMSSTCFALADDFGALVPSLDAFLHAFFASSSCILCILQALVSFLELAHFLVEVNCILPLFVFSIKPYL